MKMICKLRQLMESQEITQTALAEKTGLSPGTIGRLYRSQITRIDQGTVETLCKYFRLKSISDLFEIEWEKSDDTTINS
jgi:DNA-binding Xre family transcriptional regulator